MPGQQHTDISTFFIAGINYKKSDAAIRGQYAINSDQYASLLSLAPQYGIKELFILSTCNRTEIYGFAQSAQDLCKLLCSQTQGSLDNFTERAYIKGGKVAIEHLFDVAAGLDSQILGDYEIIGQIKNAFKFSKQHAFIGAYLERMVNGVLQSSKMIKNTTELSGGTVSVSFAAIQYIKEHVPHLADKKILLLGTGKIGRNTCKNLVDYLGTTNITLINRTESKAAELAAELGLQYAPLEDLANQIDEAAIILVATNSAEPVILESHVINGTDKLIIDLSIPYNVETAAHLLPNVTLVNVDELSKIKDLTLQKRIAEVPKAKAIIAEHINEFLNWHQMRKNVPVLKAVKIKLEQMQSCNLYINTCFSNIASPGCPAADEKIQKVINGMAVKMRHHNQRGCHYIEAINEYIA
ncbi:glutamyl-tRNA reductase [Ferruginibacter paludis]|jgi:glutamyl-tRNA reductase|uniref:glutamyl-tRNA reductase n=1 Tax=Ferruginibacter TaxID=1004303 RepID=UPI0025B5F93C|nr:MULTISPECIES: glutamyl-tRNA reductase [Ferruginibacter]MDB5279702.1 hemA [Ferruginibacter sp.]MDN3654310.1 glutamyl-tRNA reductase [Ferruginibacter paludis]